MNKLEKDILDSEMGLYALKTSKEDETAEDSAAQTEEDEAEGSEDAIIPEYTEDGVQLNIDDLLMDGQSDGDDKFFVYGYQDELDLSSLGDGENEPPLPEKERDGSRLYEETVLLITSGEVDINNGIALLRKNATSGHALSWIYLGQLYSNRSGAIYNPALAFECYKNAADMKEGEGFFNLGLCYAKGFGCEKNEDLAFECFNNGARDMNADCICALGACYEFGQGCDVNLEYAATLYEKGYELGHADSANNFGGCLFHGHGIEKDTERAIDIYKRASELGSSNASCRLGMIYEDGIEADCDHMAAFEYYKASAAAKNPIGLYRYARCFDVGIGTEQNFNKAFRYYSRSAQLGYDPAKYEAGMMCNSGRGTKKDHNVAYAYFISAAKSGYSPAQYEVADCLFEGRGAMKDRESAYDYYCMALESDDKNRANAAYKIGLCHLRGFGVKKNEELAFEYFSEGAQLKNANAMYMLGECYFFGVGTASNEVDAARCFSEAETLTVASDDEDCDNPSLLIALARCLERGIGIEKDEKRARTLYKTASEGGRADALYEMGRAALYGIGMKAEYAAARTCFLRAARKGYIPAMLMMGIFADEGRGVPKNKEDARSWYLKAVNSEDEPRISPYDFPERFAEVVKLYTESRIKAQYRLGMAIAGTDRTVKGYTEAFEYIALSAAMGYTNAQTEITKIYAGGGDLADYFEGPSFAPDTLLDGGDNPPDKQTLGEAMNKLGDTFFDGKNTLQKNETAAARCYRAGAELGNIEAAYSYGWCLRHGVGVRENDAEAVKWLKLAADKGNINAAYSYGLCCEEGSSTGIKNKREALYYYRMASNAGHAEAAQRFLMLSERDK